MFLVLVDAYSKFVDIIPMTQATSANTIAALRHTFSYFGLPEHVVTDNGSQFTSAEFQKFLTDNCIQHTTTAPGHPATNGLAERYVGDFKDKLTKIGDTGEPLQTKLDRFLLTYRATPTSLGKTPSELLMNRQPRIRLSALRAKQSKQEVKIFQDNLDNKPKFHQNQPVFVRNFGKGARWVPGVIIGTISPRNYEVQVGDIVWKRHEEQMRPRYIPSTQCSELTRDHQFSRLSDLVPPVTDESLPLTLHVPVLPDNPTLMPEKDINTEIDTPAVVSTPREPYLLENSGTEANQPMTPATEAPVRRYPTRDRKPTQRFY
ncbi:hypothetical protein QZH41_002109 [Actinostola sp. cb2023]|nr:hypothetical protein QZH41_002109 [Actinostola sp. cb2023]